MQRRFQIGRSENSRHTNKGFSVSKLLSRERDSSTIQAGSSNYVRSCLILSPLILLLCLWLYATIYIITSTDMSTSISLRGIRNRTKRMNRLIDVIRNRHQNNTSAVTVRDVKQMLERKQSVLISRNASVTITSSARGNLGPPSVLNQDPPGSDWLKDRWQAASDMHGSAIPGSHWVVLDFSAMFGSNEGAVYLTKLVLDWETAFASDYRIETRIDAPTSAGGLNDQWCILYDGGKASKVETSHQYPLVTNQEYGQSPGVKEKLPLHIIHTIDWEAESGSDVVMSDGECHALRYLRVFIRKSATGWGVSLWQVDAFGFETIKQ